MKTRWVIGLASVCALAALAAPRANQAADPLEDLFARGRAAQAAMTSIGATFTETTVSSLLRDPIVATGTIVATRPVHVVMRYATPEPKTVVLDASRLVVVYPGRGTRDEINIADIQRRVQRYFVDASPKDLRQSFDIALTSDATAGNAYLLDMTPKRQQIKEGLQRLRLWLDRTRLLLVKMRMDYRDGDSRTLELKNVVTNVPIDDRTFALPDLSPGRP